MDDSAKSLYWGMKRSREKMLADIVDWDNIPQSIKTDAKRISDEIKALLAKMDLEA